MTLAMRAIRLPSEQTIPLTDTIEAFSELVDAGDIGQSCQPAPGGGHACCARDDSGAGRKWSGQGAWVETR
jgi:hypothetical protein